MLMIVAEFYIGSGISCCPVQADHSF